jgi:L-alanine-DL-glutamate epimerase-like enolase superfamily enzyme
MNPACLGPNRREFLRAVSGGAVLSAVLGETTAALPAESPKPGLIITDLRIHQPAGVLRILTNGEPEGWCLGVSAETAQGIWKHYRQILTGRDPLQRERIWQELAAVKASPAMHACADIALWDLCGKIVGLPVFRLIGGFRDRVPACKTGRRLGTVEAVVEDATRARNQGYPGYRERFQGKASLIGSMAAATRSAVGPDFWLIHASGQPQPYTAAVQAGLELQKQAYSWIEEPLLHPVPANLKRLCSALDIPVASAGRRPATLLSSSDLLATQSVDILRIRLSALGGITGALKAARAAEAFGINCQIASESVAAGFAQVHLLGAIRNAAFFESEEPDTGVAMPLIKNPLTVETGHIAVPSAPGLGVDLSWADLERQTATRIG